MNVYSKFGLNILTMKDLRQFFLPPVKFQKVQIVPSGSNTSICNVSYTFYHVSMLLVCLSVALERKVVLVLV